MFLFRSINIESLRRNKDAILFKIDVLDSYLQKHDRGLKKLIRYDSRDIGLMIERGDESRLQTIFNQISQVFHISVKDLTSAVTEIDFVYDPVYENIRFLSDYLETQKGVTLGRAISSKDEKIALITSMLKRPSRNTVGKIADYFMIPSQRLREMDGLPPYESLIVDEELLKIQKNDLDDERIILFKNRHFIRKNYRVLGRVKRLKLVISLFLIMIPLAGYTGYCATIVSKERLETAEKYRQGSDESTLYDKYNRQQSEYHEKLLETDKQHKDDAFYCDVLVGSKIHRISDISSSTNSYVTRMELYFKFDKEEFTGMFRHYAATVLDYLILAEYQSEYPENLKPDEVSIQEWILSHSDYVDKWVLEHAREYYPGETPSNVLTEKQTMFDIGNGGFVADTYGTVKDLEEIEYKGEDGKNRILCYQKVKFEAKFEKAFDSYRYPLDSIQLKMYIQPTMDATYMRYIPDRSTNSYGETISGFSSYFKLTGGYRLVKEGNGIKNFTQKVNYYMDVNNDPAINFDHTYKTQLEVIVRANRQGISLFLQAFVNLFSVIIWICIAFYNQSYNGEDSIGMLGTGLFGAISSVLVGISMVSDAGLFSLITMINIFTLAVIMIMTYQSILARRAIVKQDKIQIAYNGVKLRITFFILIITTLVMFLGLPLISYMFGL